MNELLGFYTGEKRMGGFYGVKDLAGVWYLEYQNEDTGWNCIAVQLTIEQMEAVEEFSQRQQDEAHSFYRDLLTKMKT